MTVKNPRSTLAGIKAAQQERATRRIRVYGKERGMVLLRLRPKSVVGAG